MRALVLLAATILTTTLEGCGPAAPPAHDESTAPVSALLPVFPLRITMPGQEGILEVKSDGSILADGQIKARFVGDDVKDEHGQVIVHITADGGVVITPPKGASASHVVEKSSRFDGADDIIIDDGGTIHVAEDGGLTYRIGKGETKKAPLRVEGYRPEARREVAILFVLLTVPAKMEAVEPPSVTVAPEGHPPIAPAPKPSP